MNLRTRSWVFGTPQHNVLALGGNNQELLAVLVPIVSRIMALRKSRVRNFNS
jgi:hypothetical protein